MFNMGLTEMLLLAAIALIVIGPKQLPEVARVIGRLMNEFKRATSDFTSTLTDVKQKGQSFINESNEYMHKQREEFEKSLAEADKKDASENLKIAEKTETEDE